MASSTESSSTRKIFFVDCLTFESKDSIILQNIRSEVTHAVTQCHIPEDTIPEQTYTFRLIKQTSLYILYILIYSTNDLKKVMIQPKILTVGSGKIY